MNKRGMLAGILLGPLALYPGLLVIWPLFAIVAGLPGSYVAHIFQTVYIATFGLLVAYPVVLLVCTPVAVLLNKVGLFALPVVVALAFVASVGITYYISQPLPISYDTLLLYATSGFSVSLGYWYAYHWAI